MDKTEQDARIARYAGLLQAQGQHWTPGPSWEMPITALFAAYADALADEGDEVWAGDEAERDLAVAILAGLASIHPDMPVPDSPQDICVVTYRERPRQAHPAP